jgi:hypothetical protein
LSIIGLVMVLAVLVFFEIGAIGVVIDQWKHVPYRAPGKRHSR